MTAKAIIFRSFDPVEIDLAECHLRAADIPFVRIGRGNAAILGAGDSIVEQLIEVDDEHAAQARELLAAVASELPPEVEAPVDEEEEEQEASPIASGKMRFIAGAMSLLWPGLGAAYVGFPLTGAAVAVWSFVALMESFRDPLGFAVFGGLLPRIVDFVGAQYWLSRFGRRGRSFVPQALLAAVLVTGFVLGQRHLSEYLWRMLPEDTAEAPQDEH